MQDIVLNSMIWRIVKSPFISGLLFALLMAVVCLTYLSPDRQFFVAVGEEFCFFLSADIMNDGRAVS